ncbi:hypothetical protein GGR51DRAFT_561436 [Nemania sp. FL0031]|nr:hypothetical protein GGR51DRAFT_561436 [Nemania sp. FL0031]
MPNFIGTLAAILPLVAAAPYGMSPRDGTASCTSTSSGDFSWTIESFTYHASYVFSTPAHQIASGQVAFNLTNPAVAETVECTAYSTWLSDFFYGNINYNCTAPAGSSTQTSFAFSRPANQLDVNQTWTCSEGEYPVTFSGRGSVVLPANCQDYYYQNPNWTSGAIYSIHNIDCGPDTLPLTPFDKTAVA